MKKDKQIDDLNKKLQETEKCLKIFEEHHRKEICCLITENIITKVENVTMISNSDDNRNKNKDSKTNQQNSSYCLNKFDNIIKNKSRNKSIIIPYSINNKTVTIFVILRKMKKF